MSNSSLALLSAIGALLTAVVAFGTAFYQGKMQRFITGVDLLVRLEQEYNGDAMIRWRQQASIALTILAQTGRADVPVISLHGLENVLAFYDRLGYLVRKKAIDKETVWVNFYHGSVHYWKASEKYIAQIRSIRPEAELWEEFARLYRTLQGVEAKKLSCDLDTVIPNAASTRLFIEAEKTLSRLWQEALPNEDVVQSAKSIADHISAIDRRLATLEERVHHNASGAD